MSKESEMPIVLFRNLLMIHFLENQKRVKNRLIHTAVICGVKLMMDDKTNFSKLGIKLEDSAQKLKKTISF
jgi:hypothetical protein